MSVKIEASDTLASLARKLVGDGRLVHEVMVPGWSGQGPLPAGKHAYLRDERPGPPTRNWTEPRRG